MTYPLEAPFNNGVSSDPIPALPVNRGDLGDVGDVGDVRIGSSGKGSVR